RRLGVSPAPVALKGPVMVNVCMCGRPAQSKLSIELRRNGCRRFGSCTGGTSPNAAGTTWGAGGGGDRDAQPRIHGITRIRRLVEQRLEIVPSADRRGIHAPAVDGELDLVRILQAAHDVQVRAIELHLKDVVAVQRKRIALGRAADGAERKAL